MPHSPHELTFSLSSVAVCHTPAVSAALSPVVICKEIRMKRSTFLFLSQSRYLRRSVLSSHDRRPAELQGRAQWQGGWVMQTGAMQYAVHFYWTAKCKSQCSWLITDRLMDLWTLHHWNTKENQFTIKYTLHLEEYVREMTLLGKI